MMAINIHFPNTSHNIPVSHGVWFRNNCPKNIFNYLIFPKLKPHENNDQLFLQENNF